MKKKTRPKATNQRPSGIPITPKPKRASCFFGRNSLICTSERWHRFTLVLIQSVHRHAAVADINLAVRLFLPSERMLDPLVVVALRIIFTCVCSTRLCPICGCLCRLNTICKSISILDEKTLCSRRSIRTRKSRDFSAQVSQQDQSSRSCSYL